MAWGAGAGFGGEVDRETAQVAVQVEVPPLRFTFSGAVTDPELDGIESATALWAVDKLAGDAGAAAYEAVKVVRNVRPLSAFPSSS